MRKYKLNENFFNSIDTETKAYFLGLLYADGYVSKNLNYVEITLIKKDKKILEIFVESLYSTDRPLYLLNEKYYRLTINSKILVGDLIKHGCLNKKTYNLKFPTTINKKFYKHFIRGYFDGDGCIYVSKNNSLNLSMVGTIKFLDSVKKILNTNCSLNKTVYDNRHPERNNNIRALRYGGNILINRIFHYLYDDSSIYLLRKYNIFVDILKNKSYFCNKKYSRISHKKYFEYQGVKYTKSQLSKILAKKVVITKETIRKKLTYGWSVDDILKTEFKK